MQCSRNSKFKLASKITVFIPDSAGVMVNNRDLVVNGCHGKESITYLCS